MAGARPRRARDVAGRPVALDLAMLQAMDERTNAVNRSEVDVIEGTKKHLPSTSSWLGGCDGGFEFPRK